jgi:hypothetical protein
MSRYFQILSPQRNNSLRATFSERDGKYLIDVEDSGEEPADSESGWATVWINVYTGEFGTVEERDRFWRGFVKATELVDPNAEVREVTSHDEDYEILD